MTDTAVVADRIATGPEAVTQSTTGPSQETPPVDVDAIVRQRIAETDPKELARLNRGFANEVGNVADALERKRSEARRREWEVDQEARKETQELRDLRKSDPAEYAARMEARDEREEGLRRENARLEGIQDNLIRSLDEQIMTFAKKMPHEIIAQFRDKQWDKGDPVASRMAFIEDVTDAWRKHSLNTEIPTVLARERAKMESELREVLAQATAAENLSNEPTVDTGRGAPAVGYATQAEFNANRSNKQWVANNWGRIQDGLGAGAIRR